MQISLLYNVEHLDRRPLVKAVRAVAVGGHLEDAVDVVGGDDLAVVVAEVAHEPEVEPMTQEEDLLEVSSETLVLQDQVLGLEQDEVAEVVAVVVDLAEVVLDEAWVRSGVWLNVFSSY